ncbi:unnamed protein product [Phaedon cochleariae]|uniref:CCHC-type domain-containing protein n=1 Tax=Phaedon cochleariae TaxID=80249 RepID=A0A9N9SGC9_PHACE|nr:unnamed protein product [Phaedon cochleariae]
MSPILPGSDMFVDKTNPSSKAKKKTTVKVGRNSGKTKAAKETNLNSLIQLLRSQNEQQQKLIENLTKTIEQLRKDLENSADMHFLAKQAKIKAQECTKAGGEGAAETFDALASMIKEQTAKAVPTNKEITPPPQTPPKTVLSIPEYMEIEEEKQKGIKRRASSSPPPKASTSTAAPTPQKGNDEPAKKTTIPPIVLKTPGEWTTVKRKLESNGIKIPSVKLMRGGLRIQTNDANEYRTTTKILEQDKHEYHTYSLPEDKLLSVVMRGIDMSVEIPDIEDDLKSKGLEIKIVHRMKSYKTKLDSPLVIIQVPKSETRIWEIKDCCSYVVRIEAQRQVKNQIPQCHRCQKYGHSQKNCRCLYRCVKCGDQHPTADCTKPRTTDAKCANCSGKHFANYRGCPKCPKPATKATPPKPNQKPTPKTQPGKSYAAATAPKIQPQKAHRDPQQTPTPTLPPDFMDFIQKAIGTAVRAVNGGGTKKMTASKTDKPNALQCEAPSIENVEEPNVLPQVTIEQGNDNSGSETDDLLVPIFA